MGTLHPALRSWRGDREMLNVTKAETELSWEGAMLRPGEKRCRRREAAPLYLYWHRSGYSSVIVLFKSTPVPRWEGNEAIPVSGAFKSVWHVPVKGSRRKTVLLKTHMHFNRMLEPLPKPYLEQT